MSAGTPRNVPMMVRAARLSAEKLGFDRSCSDEVGKLLELLVSQFPGELIGEIGGGAGVGTAWMASGLQPDARLISVEIDETLVAATRSQLGDHSGVVVVHGEWRAILEYGPYAMIFVDVAEAKQRHLDEVIDSMRPGGLAVIDDLTPGGLDPGQPDPLRERWLAHPRLRAMELTIAPESAVILATRLR